MLSNQQRFKRYLAPTSDNPMGIEVERAEGIWLYTPDGKAYIDLISGISVSALGHGHHAVTQAIRDQLDCHLHVMVYGEYIQAPQVLLAEKLVSLLPESLNNVFFTNSGSEAVEGAMKLARRFTGRPEMVTFQRAYHGHTQGALSMMGDEVSKQKYRPLLPGIRVLPFNDADSLKYITKKTACVLIEPVQGEAGVIAAVPGFLQALRKQCTETGTLLIFDEAQTGMGRTGSMFACTGLSVVPDILILAKALGAGMPLGAFIADASLMKVLSEHPPLGHITTFGGHPLSCAAGLAGIQTMLDEKLIEEVDQKARLFYSLLKDHPLVKEVRFSGLLMAVELGNETTVQKVIHEATSRGLLTDWFLFCPTAIRLAPPLNISTDDIQEACRILLASMDAAG